MPHEKYSYVAVLHRFYLMWNHLLENTRFGICVISRVLPFLKSEVGPHLWDPWFKIFTTLARVCLAFTKRLYHSTSTWFWCSLHIRALVGSFSLWCFLSSSMHYMKSFYLPQGDCLLTKPCILHFRSRIVYILWGSLSNTLRYIYLLPSTRRPFVSLVHEASTWCGCSAKSTYNSCPSKWISTRPLLHCYLCSLLRCCNSKHSLPKSLLS